MNVNLNQFTSMKTKKESINKKRPYDTIKNLENNFSKSMEKSLNSLNKESEHVKAKNNNIEKPFNKIKDNNKNSQKIDKNTYDINNSENMEIQENDIEVQESENKDELKKVDSKKQDEEKELKNLLYIINFIYSNDTKDKKNIFDLNNNQIGEEIDVNIISDLLSKIGVDINKINSKNVSKEEITSLLTGENTAFENVLEELDLGYMLDNQQLLNNIKNEISKKLSTNSNLETETLNVTEDLKIPEMKPQEHMNPSTTNDKNILKEISGDSDLNNNYNMQFLDNIRNIDSKNFENVYANNLNTRVTTKFVREFIDSIKYMQDNNKSQMIVKLNPEHLGKMDIKYETVKDQIRLIIRVENEESLKIMNNAITDIKNIISETHEINLENIQVDLNQFQFNEDNQNNSRNDNNESKSKNTLKINDEDNKIESKNKDLRSGILV